MKMRLALLLSLSTSCALAQCRIQKLGDTLVLQNELLKLSIDLKNGARVSEFFYEPFKENIVYPVKSNGGMLMDHIWEQTWPGEFLFRKYNAEILKKTPEEASIRVWTMGEGETVRGVRFERVITLRGGSRALLCTVSLTNTSNKGRLTGYWIQNNFWLGGRKEGLTWWRPSTRGIDTMGLDASGKQWFSYNWYYVSDPTAGWTAVSSPEIKKGLMLLMDYNDLWRFYDNASAVTTEWMYDKVAIPPGKTWKTDIIIIPVLGMEGFTYGSRYLIAYFSVKETAGALIVKHKLTASLVPLRSITLRTRAWGLKEKWETRSRDIHIDTLSDSVITEVVRLPGTGRMPAGIAVLLSATTPDRKQIIERYGDYYGGAEGKNQDPFTTKPYLTFERPPKKKRYLRPDVIKLKPNKNPRLLLLRGLWAEFFRVEEAFKREFPDGEVVTGWLDESPVGLALSYFPADYSSLLSFDLIVLANIPAPALGLIGQEMLKDYLKAGGGLLLLGGDQAFGQAHFTNEELIKLLPVELGSTYNWRKLKGNRSLHAVPALPTTKGVNFSERDIVLYHHICKPKKGATVAVRAGEYPILITDYVGRGRVACVLSTPFGEASPGEVPFWESPSWFQLMQNTVRWLLKSEASASSK